jgi:hypothetical protein
MTQAHPLAPSAPLPFATPSCCPPRYTLPPNPGRVSCLGVCVSGFGFRVRVSGSGFAGFRVRGSGFGVEGSVCRVQGPEAEDESASPAGPLRAPALRDASYSPPRYTLPPNPGRVSCLGVCVLGFWFSSPKPENPEHRTTTPSLPNTKNETQSRNPTPGNLNRNPETGTRNKSKQT